jgi:hypothetical protein
MLLIAAAIRFLRAVLSIFDSPQSSFYFTRLRAPANSNSIIRKNEKKSPLIPKFSEELNGINFNLLEIAPRNPYLNLDCPLMFVVLRYAALVGSPLNEFNGKRNKKDSSKKKSTRPLEALFIPLR